MNILMISPQFRPILGGYEMAAERLSQALAERGHRVMVISERRQPHWPRQESYGKITINRWWCIYRKGVHMMTSLFGLAFWLLKNGRKFEVWHIHQYGLQATMAVSLSRLLRRPLVLKLTSSGPQSMNEALLSMRFQWLHRRAHSEVSACIAISEETFREALEFGIPAARVRKIANGINTLEFRVPTPEERVQSKFNNRFKSGFLVVAVGRLATIKNPLGLIEAWAYVNHLLPTGSLLVWVGDGPLKKKVEDVILKLELAESVVLFGQTNEVFSVYSAADVFVLPSHTEGLSNALLEAMACGLPSVATAVSGTFQLLTQNNAGIVVSIGDMRALGDAILSLAKDVDGRKAMGARARSVVETTYSLDVISGQFEALYEELSNEK